MMLDTASSTARMMALLCSAENPNISIKGSRAPRTTQSKVGWLRSSSFSRKTRFNFEGLFVSRGWFAAIGVMFGLGSPSGIIPGYRQPGLWQGNIILPRTQWNFLRPPESASSLLDDWVKQKGPTGTAKSFRGDTSAVPLGTW